MKQLFTTTKAFIPAFSHYCLIFLFGVIAIMASNCQKDKDPNKKTVPFIGSFAVTTGDEVHGIGKATPIGNFTLVAKDDETNFPNITGVVTITTANGDQIFANHTGLATELGKNMLEVDFDNTITGGTGQFAGASGNFKIQAVIDETLSSGNATLYGTISY